MTATRSAIRKTTPGRDALLRRSLRAVASANAPNVDRYYVRSPERAVAIVTHAGATNRGRAYLHADNLGSTDTITDEGGNVVENREL